ncbi:MAG: hypothetical protein Q8942_13550 [Bacillota bacterium]|nr:hypothetical protein [Bacillota bacterium]
MSKIIPFLCPVMMLLMMPMMFRKNKEDGSGNVQNHCDTNKIESNHLK